MMTEIRGYYDGQQIILDEEERINLSSGQKVMVRLLENTETADAEAKRVKRLEMLRSRSCVIPSGKMSDQIVGDIRRMRDEDRF